jgi:hypothetical protein
MREFDNVLVFRYVSILEWKSRAIDGLQRDPVQCYRFKLSPPTVNCASVSHNREGDDHHSHKNSASIRPWMKAVRTSFSTMEAETQPEHRRFLHLRGILITRLVAVSMSERIFEPNSRNTLRHCTMTCLSCSLTGSHNPMCFMVLPSRVTLQLNVPQSQGLHRRMCICETVTKPGTTYDSGDDFGQSPEHCIHSATNFDPQQVKMFISPCISR